MSRHSFASLAAILLTLALSAGVGPGTATRAQGVAVAAPVYRILVKFRTDKSSALPAAQPRVRTEEVAALALRQGLALRRERAVLPRLHVLEVQTQGTDSLAALLARVRSDPAVVYAEPDQRRHVSSTPNDPLYGPTTGATGQWYLQLSSSTPSALDAIDAWSASTGSAGLVIADIDTGVRFDHPDLLRAGASGRLLPGYTFISDTLVANDGATWDADASDPGDWITQADTQTSEFSGCTVGPSSWHGTRVVGILGALTNNSVGIAGLTWNGWILPVRALGKCGGQDSDIETAMLWAAGEDVSDSTYTVPLNPYPARIINLSLGGSGSCPSSYQDVITQLTGMGVTVVASAGNAGGPVEAPANCNGVVAVAGLRDVGTKVGFSSLGPQIALSAPGGNCVNSSGACLYSIDTTVNLGTTTPGANSYTNQTNYNVGTSFAAPLVSGTAGLMLAVNANLSPAQLTARLQQGATTPFPVSSDTTVPTCHVPTSDSDLQTSECNCTTSTCGAGMANANGAVNEALRPIAAVLLPGTVVSGQSVALDASGSAAACTHSIVSYAWTISGGGSLSSASGSTTTVVAAPAAGTTYTVSLTVTDDQGRTDTASITVNAQSASSTAPASAGNAGSACLATITPVLPITVTVAPSSASVQAGLGSQSFTAAVTSTANTSVSWQVNGINGGNSSVGTITAAGLYTPPLNLPATPTVTVIAVANAEPSMTGFAGVTITAPVAVSVTPASAIVLAGATQAFSAMVSNSSNTAVSWAVNGVAGGNATLGTISSSGVYSAPTVIPTPATVNVTATAAADPTRSGSAAVTVAHVNVVVTPSAVVVPVGASQSFLAAVMNTSNTAVTWQVNGITGGNASLGLISSSGVYTAPSAVPAPSSLTVSAVPAADPTRPGTATVTISASGSSSSGASSSSGSSSGGSSSSGSSSGTASSGGSHGGGGALGWLSLLSLGAVAARRVVGRHARDGARADDQQTCRS
jgi:serine protease